VLKDINSVILSGTIFWSKLDDRQTWAVLRLGIALSTGDRVFCSVNNPYTKTYEVLKPGNKVLITNGHIDIWEKDNGISEVQIKANGNGVQFFPQEKAIMDINNVILLGKAIKYSNCEITLNIIGERNPKTDIPTERKAIVKVSDGYENTIDRKVLMQCQIKSESNDGKSKMVVEALYDKILIF